MRSRRRHVLAALIAGELLGTAVMRARGYRVGGNTIVRCRSGHLFTTLWIPGVSVKSLRFVWWRVQRCPVGRHWTVVTPVREADLTRSQWRAAQSRRDIRVP